MAMTMVGQIQDIQWTVGGHLWLMSTYRDSVLAELVERLNRSVDLLLSHTIAGEELEQLQADIREMTAALVHEQICSCCANPNHIRLACEKHSKNG
jgi:hypothetical protein